MKLTSLIVVILVCMMSCTNKQSTVEEELPITNDTIVPLQLNYDSRAAFRIYRDHGRFLDDFILGDFDQDLIKDTAYLWVPMDTNREFKMFGCNPCRTEISFSNDLPSIERTMDIGGWLVNAGDLDDDGIDEIAYDNGWFIGCWGIWEFYKLKDEQWVNAAQVRFYACEADPFEKYVKKLGNGKIKLIGDALNCTEDPEYIFDLKADSLPCLVSKKVCADDDY